MQTAKLAFSIETQEVAPSKVTIKGKDVYTVYPRLVRLFIDAFELMASQKTMKYFINDSSFEQRLIDVVQTIEAIRCSQSNTISVDGESYAVSEYKIPTRLVDYVNAGIIYASSDAVGSRAPIIKVNGCTGKLTPLQFNKFFDDFNINQETKLNTVESFNRSTTVLGDVQYAEDEHGMMIRLSETGLDIETCYLVGIRIDGLGDYLTSYSMPNKDGITKWLFS